jgi:hypothetical protein
MIEMRPPCELIVKYLLPAFRSLIAKELTEKYNFTQMEAAKKLGTTQAAISQYLGSKRGEKYIKEVKKLPEAKKLIEDIARSIAEEKATATQTMQEFCQLCKNLRHEKALCKLHREIATLPEICEICPEKQ